MLRLRRLVLIPVLAAFLAFFLRLPASPPAASAAAWHSHFGLGASGFVPIQVASGTETAAPPMPTSPGLPATATGSPTRSPATGTPTRLPAAGTPTRSAPPPDTPIPSPSLDTAAAPATLAAIPSTTTPAGCPPPATPEPMWVDPLLSPAAGLTQTVTVRLGRGRAVTVTAESGTLAVAGTFDVSVPALVVVRLLPNTVHHLVVAGRVEYAPGCFYTLTTRQDRLGNPLVLVQGTPTASVSLSPPANSAPLSEGERGRVREIRISDSAFFPPVITVTAGSSLRLTNVADGPHTATGAGFLWDSGELAPGQSVTVTFTLPGIYPYHCALHPALHAPGTVVVLGPAARPPALFPLPARIEPPPDPAAGLLPTWRRLLRY